MGPISIFVCHSRADRRWIDPKSPQNLIPWLARSLRRDNVGFWVDRRNGGNEEWRKETRTAIVRSKIAILLVDEQFLTSEVIEDVEMPPIHARVERGEMAVLPILTKPCNWQRHPLLETLQMLPLDMTPLIERVSNPMQWENTRVQMLYALGRQIDLAREKQAQIALAESQSEHGLDPSPEIIEPPKLENRKLLLFEDIEKLSPSLAIDLDQNTQMKFALVRPGFFWMGSKLGNSNERPVHKVNIGHPFYLGRYVVTQEQWRAVMEDNPSSFRGPRNPVDHISWDDCQAFLRKLKSRFPRYVFHLPTEEQWEYACRADSTTEFFHGDKADGLEQYAWFGDNAYNSTHPVGEKKPNAWGLYDMHGNVWEWCSDWYARYAGASAAATAEQATKHGRILRGGSWHGRPARCRSAYRYFAMPDVRNYTFGFRLVCLPPELT